MIHRLIACVIGSGIVLLGACDQPPDLPQTARLWASTSIEAVPSILDTTPPPTVPTTALATTTSTTPPAPTSTTLVAVTTVTSTTIPVVTARLYPMFERGSDIVQLQMHLGMKSVDGIYGPVTRQAHIDYFGGPVAALAVFYPHLNELVTGGDTTLGELINRYFQPADRAWARQVAFCESSAQTHHTGSAVVSSAFAIGWFQHLAKYWEERSDKAGVPGASPFDPEPNVAVAAWLFYEGGGARHWNPSRTCWEEQ